MRQELNGISRRRSLLGLLAPCLAVALAIAPRAAGQCSLRSAVNFGAGNAPGASDPFRAGYENDVSIFTTSSGARRLLLMFNYGYGVMDLTNPGSPRATVYADMSSNIPPHGDGQNYITSMGVAPDGARAVFSLGPQATPFNAVVGSASGSTFNLRGDFAAPAATGGAVIQKTGDGRYFAYALINKLIATNITSLPGGNLAANSIPSETSAFPTGTALQLAGNTLSYLSGNSVILLDASNPGSSPGSITTNFSKTTLLRSDFNRSSGSAVSLATAVDPSDPTALYVLVEFSGTPPTYSLVRVQGSTKTLVNSFPIPTLAGETWTSGYSSALVTSGNDVFVLMWAHRTTPSTLYRLYTTSVLAFGSVTGSIDFDPAVYNNLSVGLPMRGFGSSGGAVNAYLATFSTAWAFSLSCASPNSPATADMTVRAGATPLADGATVFLGDTVTVSPIVNPPPGFRPLSDWRFDFDFHPGSSEDNGASALPRLSAPDLSYPVSGATPPAALTLVGPCDPRSGGTPSTGAGCWASETSNGDFAPNPPAGTTIPLTLALEATNVNGSSGARVFTLNWKVPAVRLVASQVLLGTPLTSGSDGHPSPSGFKWYFGSSPTSLVLQAACVTSSCQPPQVKGTYYYWLTVPYANGYTSPDCGSPCTQSLGSFSVSDVSLAFTSVSTSVFAGQSIQIQDASTYATGVTPCPSTGTGFEYSLCDATAGSCPAGTWQPLGLARAGSTSIPAPSTAGTWWLRVRYNYSTTGVCPSALYASWPGSAQTDPGYAIVVVPVPPTIFVRVNGQDPCPPGPGGGCNPGSFPANVGDTITVWADLNGVHDPNPPAATNWDFGAGASPGSCAGTGCQSFAFTYSAGGNSTITLTGYATTATIQAQVAVQSVAASNNGPVCAGTPLTLAATGPASATYAWTGPNGFTAAVQNPTIATPTTAASGVYQVTRTYSGTTTAQTTATVKAPPMVPTAGNNGPLCTGQTLTLTAAPVSGATYAWTGPNSFTSSLQNPTISNVTAAAAGTYTVTATVNGCSTAASTGVTVNARPPAPAAANSGPVCAGGTLALTASTIANATYAWTGPNGFTSTLQNPSIPNVTGAAAGTYSVTATVNGCTGPVGSTTAVVNAISAAIAAPTQICLTNGNTGAASVPDAGGGASYAWTIANGTITGGQGTPSIAFSVAGAGTTTLGVTVVSGSCSPSGSATIAVQTQCGGLSTLTPCRAVDTRNATGPLGAPSLQSNGVRLFSLVSVCGIPPGAMAVSANLTVVGPTASGALHVYPGDLATAPSATAISFSPGVTRANNAILRLATDGSGTVAVLCDSGGTTDFIIDVNGYFE